MTRALALVTALLLAVPAHAGPSETAQAKKLYVSGTKHYNLREYEAALADFREAYRLKDDPVFLYNIAQCYRLLENRSEAASFYRSYLRNVPNAPNRVEIEQRIATMEQEIAEQKARAEAEQKEKARAEAAERERLAAITAQQQDVVVAAPPRRQPVYKKWWLWTAVGGAVVVGVGLGVGLGLGLRRDATTTFPSVDLR